MIIFVHGQNPFLQQQKVDGLKKHFLGKFEGGAMNLVEFPASGVATTVGEVMQAAKTPPFLADKRMVIVKDQLGKAKKDERDAWMDHLKTIPETTILIFNDQPDGRLMKGFLSFVASVKSAYKDTFEYPYKKGERKDVIGWLNEYVTSHQIQISPSTLQELVMMTGDDYTRSKNELDKLVALACGSEVTQQLVREHVVSVHADDMFGLMDAISNKNEKQALSLLQKQRFFGSTDIHILAMLARQIRLLLRMCTYNGTSAAKDLGIHPFVAQKLQSQVRSFSKEELVGLHERVLEVEQAVKTSAVKTDVAVDRLLVAML